MRGSSFGFLLAVFFCLVFAYVGYYFGRQVEAQEAEIIIAEIQEESVARVREARAQSGATADGLGQLQQQVTFLERELNQLRGQRDDAVNRSKELSEMVQRLNEEIVTTRTQMEELVAGAEAMRAAPQMNEVPVPVRPEQAPAISTSASVPLTSGANEKSTVEARRGADGTIIISSSANQATPPPPPAPSRPLAAPLQQIARPSQNADQNKTVIRRRPDLSILREE